MQLLLTRPFEEDYEELPEKIQRLVDRKLDLLLRNPYHPSLRIKKMHDPREIWEGRITRGYRFTCQIKSDLYILRRVGAHDILKTP